jgi:hypothetical protein
VFQTLLRRLRGREQLLVRAGEALPLFLFSFPKGAKGVALEIESALSLTFQGLSAGVRAPYQDVLARLPAIVVVVLQGANPCGCLGHHHPPGTESRAARRLDMELGSTVGEIDLAYDCIRNWNPQPLAGLAAPGGDQGFANLRFRIAVLAVLLHELEHLAFADRPEPEIRARSNRFYESAMSELVSETYGEHYGMTSPPLP